MRRINIDVSLVKFIGCGHLSFVSNVSVHLDKFIFFMKNLVIFLKENGIISIIFCNTASAYTLPVRYTHYILINYLPTTHDAVNSKLGF